MQRIAAIDIGTNAIRLAIAEIDQTSAYRIISSERESLRFGTDVFSNGSISMQTAQRALGVLKQMKERCVRHKVARIRVVGTSALREARNSSQFVERVRKATGIKIQIISGTEEARLVHLAVASKLNLKRKLAVIIDIGGGSTEVIVVNDGNIIIAESHKIGAVRLLHFLEAERHHFKVFARLVGAYVRGLENNLKRQIGKRKIELCVGTGGNFEALGLLRMQLLGKKTKDEFSINELKQIIAELNELSITERISKLGIRSDRADVIGPASLVIAQIMTEAGVKQVKLPHVGLKEGVLLDMIPQVFGKEVRINRSQVIAFAREVGRKFGYDEEHANSVARHALRLFEQTEEVHKLNGESRTLLEIAARLHDIGHYINEHDHHKHTLYIIQSLAFVGLDRRQQNIVACIARYHRKASPQPDHEVFSQLSIADRKIVVKLASLLRLADVLDREEIRSLKTIRVKRKRGVLQIVLRGKGEPVLERILLDKKSKLFEDALNLRVEAVRRG